MKVLNSFTADTFKNYQLGAGVLLMDVDFSNVTDETTLEKAITDALAIPQKKIGATSGGGNLSVIPQWRDLTENTDGAVGKYKGGMVIDRVDCKLTGTLIEIKKENIQMAIGCSESAAVGTATKITGRYEVKDTDYMNNATWVSTLNRDKGLMVVVFKNALNTAGFSLDFKDKDNGTYGIEIEPFIDPAKAEESPFEIYIL